MADIINARGSNPSYIITHRPLILSHFPRLQGVKLSHSESQIEHPYPTNVGANNLAPWESSGSLGHYVVPYFLPPVRNRFHSPTYIPHAHPQGWVNPSACQDDLVSGPAVLLPEWGPAPEHHGSSVPFLARFCIFSPFLSLGANFSDPKNLFSVHAHLRLHPSTPSCPEGASLL
ncbi:hypothetical protein SODALDRAFT_355772 [Sodiomyces alkalinus F11]|uniref:Uncharacterized protein n=1 Tax=Sodiomyces alkalinus (strain CBS 110278 / VKM F-3762 / F11) TaxID=1314773 RepID=A0A3N2QA66_SODAK|nr:hypothetical protein SODALDRAFT_355772 [Sodiomyces alkalinus F11]ROT43558.1 hypothetical protein SODALDRAFT_355772 [Sodiomyces alkalinus F11]